MIKHTFLFIAAFLLFPDLAGAQTYFWWNDDIYTVGDSQGFGEDTYTNKVHSTRIVEVTPWIESASSAVNTFGAGSGAIVKSTTGDWKEVISETEWRDWPDEIIESLGIVNATRIIAIEVNSTTTITNEFFVDHEASVSIFNSTDVTQIFETVNNYLFDTRMMIPIGKTADGTLTSASVDIPLPNFLKGEDIILHAQQDETKRDGIPFVIRPDQFIANASGFVHIPGSIGNIIAFQDPFPPWEIFDVTLFATFNTNPE